MKKIEEDLERNPIETEYEVFMIPVAMLDNFILLQDIDYPSTCAWKYHLFDKNSKRIVLDLITCNFLQCGFQGISTLLVKADPEYAGQSLAKKVYKELVKLGNNVVSGPDQSTAGRALWNSLCKDLNVTLCKFKDDNPDYIVEKNIKLKGLEDERVWDNDLMTRLVIMKKDNGVINSKKGDK